MLLLCMLYGLQDVNAGDAEARTPLHYASGYNHLEIAKMLIEEGAQLEAKDSKVGGAVPQHAPSAPPYTC